MGVGAIVGGLIDRGITKRVTAYATGSTVSARTVRVLHRLSGGDLSCQTGSYEKSSEIQRPGGLFPPPVSGASALARLLGRVVAH
jgi:hypothetical protein